MRESLSLREADVTSDVRERELWCTSGHEPPPATVAIIAKDLNDSNDVHRAVTSGHERFCRPAQISLRSAHVDLAVFVCD